MKVNISNIIVSINKNQEKEIYKELEKNGISRDNIENLKYLKKSIDSRKKNDIKFIYTLEISLKKNINLEKMAILWLLFRLMKFRLDRLKILFFKQLKYYNNL